MDIIHGYDGNCLRVKSFADVVSIDNGVHSLGIDCRSASAGCSLIAFSEGNKEDSNAVLITIIMTVGILAPGNSGYIMLLNPKPDIAAPEKEEISMPAVEK